MSVSDNLGFDGFAEGFWDLLDLIEAVETKVVRHAHPFAYH
jgi:hypothetical protein